MVGRSWVICLLLVIASADKRSIKVQARPTSSDATIESEEAPEEAPNVKDMEEDSASDHEEQEISKAEISSESKETDGTKLLQTHAIEDKESKSTKSMEEVGFTPFGYGMYGGSNAPYIHNPVNGRPFVEHLTGGTRFPSGLNGDTRSIVVSPSFGPTSGGVWVQIVGAGSFHTPNSLQCKLDLVEQFCYSNHYFYSWCYLTPKCAGVYPFKCHNGPMQFEGKYAVIAKTPWVTSVYPFSGDTAGGTPVTVRGWNFEPHCPKQLLCKFGDQVVPAKYYTSSSVMCIAPCNSQKGFVSVEVSNDGGMHWSMSGVQYGFVGDSVDLASGECQRYLSVEYSKATH